MATDQKSSTVVTDSELAGSPIENELTNYRAISNKAVFSLTCGALSVFCLANPIFYAASILAVILGILAHQSVRKHPDMLTGLGLANAGIACGLIFGLGCGTYTVVQTLVTTRMAETFARQFEGTLQENSLGDILYANLHPDQRKDQTPDQLVKSIEGTKSKEQFMAQDKYGGLLALNRRLKSSKDEHVHFVRIESVGVDDSKRGEMPVFALAVYEIDGPGNKSFPEKEQFALAVMKGRKKGGQYEWWVDSIRFPYKPESYVHPTAAPDDGHGHAH